MKRITMMLAVSLCFVLTLSAQNRNREDMMEKRAEKLANEFGLKDEVKTTFKTQYTAYLQELFNARMQGISMPDTNAEKIEDLSEDEIKALIQKKFDNEAQQIVNSYNALNVEKKYYEEFSKILTPAQLYKVFVPQMLERNQRPGINRPGGNSGRSQRMPRGNRAGGFGNENWGNDPFSGK